MRVLIVGGSMAGLSTARAIQELCQAEVVVCEQKAEVGTKIVCGEGVGVSALRRGKVGIPERFVACKLRGARIFAPNGSYAEVRGEGVYG
ncbi:MAG: NAD(P)-binding protein, partial [Candidatus Hadarchaeales archaeon]